MGLENCSERCQSLNEFSVNVKLTLVGQTPTPFQPYKNQNLESRLFSLTSTDRILLTTAKHLSRENSGEDRNAH